MYNRFNTGTNDTSTMNSCNTVFPRDIVCLRNISINTLHKGDDDDDNDNDNNISETNKPFPRFLLLIVIPFWPITTNGPSLSYQPFFQGQFVFAKNKFTI